MGKNYGINIKLARMFYLAFIRSVIDYHALHLAMYKESHIEKLDKVQNEAMRLILGAPMSARIVNMRTELNLPSIYERVLYINTTFGVKALREPVYFTKFQRQLKLKITQPHHQLEPGTLCSGTWLQSMSSCVLRLNIPIDKILRGRTIPPWKIRNMDVHYINVPKKDSVPGTLIKQYALANIDDHLETVGEVYLCYTDGSLQLWGPAGCACVVYKYDVIQYQNSIRIHDWASTTQAELAGMHLATEFLQSKGSGVIFCDSQSALQAMNSFGNSPDKIVTDIRLNVLRASRSNFVIHFIWLPSHIAIARHDLADKLAREACTKPDVDMDLGIPLARVKHAQVRSNKEDLQDLRNSQRPASISVKHYDQYVNVRFIYGTHKARTRQCDIVTARIRLGYRHIWQVNETGNVEYTKCKLCDAEFKHTLEHYIAECHVIEPFRPPNKRYQEICDFFTNTDVLEDILALYPKFAM